jgi:hypothetical protein
MELTLPPWTLPYRLPLDERSPHEWSDHPESAT